MTGDPTSGSLRTSIVSATWRALSATLPRNQNSISICTFPDYDDTLRALQSAATERSIFLDVLVANAASMQPNWLDPSVCRVRAKTSLEGLVAFHRSSSTLFTHGLYSTMPIIPNRPTLNLWHGMPVKRIGLLDSRSTSRLPKSHWVIAENEFFRSIMAEAFGMNESQVLIMEHPRLDIMTTPPYFRKWWPETERSLIVWLPTYRQSSRGEIRVDGGDLPIASEAEMRRLDSLLDSQGGTILVKLHPMDVIRPDTLPLFRHIEFIDDTSLRSRGVSLYQLLGIASALVTDISSVLFDFRHTGRPIWAYFPDRDAYETSRGFVAPLDQLITEPVLSRFDELLEHLRTFLSHQKAVLNHDKSVQADRAAKTLDYLMSAESKLT